LDFRIALTTLKSTDGAGIPQEYRTMIQNAENEFSALTTIKLRSANEIVDFADYTKTNTNGAYFWSGMGIDGANKALEIAKAKGGKTLERVLVDNNILMPDWNDNPNVWETASEAYAKQASGVVRAVIGKYVSSNSIWITKELPALKANKSITKIIQINAETLEEVIIFKR
jgi:hypothetical protein